MRKITKTLVLLAAAAMAFASCSKEKETPVPTPEEGTIRVKFAADAALTKVGLTPNDGDTQFSATWNEDDQIEITSFVHGGAMKETVSAEWSSDDKCFTTLFEYEQYAEGLYDFVGVWPVGKDADKLFPAERHQKGSSYNGDYDLMKSSRASAATLTADETIVLDMVRQTSIAYFHITSELNENIVSATLTTDKPIASSNATLDYNGFKPNAETAGVTSIKLIIDGEMSSSDFKLWFNVLPVQYETMSLLIETANHSFSLSKKSSGEWKAGELNKVVLTNVPAEKWAEIERPAGEVTNTLTMDGRDGHTYTTSDGIITATFVNNGGNSAPYWSGSELRMYQKNKLTVSASDENLISRIEYYANKNYKSGNIPVLSVNVGELDEEDFVWTGSSSSVVLSFSTNSGNYGFTSLKVTYTDPNASSDPIYKYSVMVDKNVTNGTVTVDKTSAKEGDEVTITATPSDGYELVAGSVKAYNAVSGAELTATNSKFTMPAANVNVTAAFSLIPTLSATSPEPYASNLTNNSGKGFSIPVTANQAWVAAIKTDDPNAADITLMTSEGEGGENNNLVFSFNSQNTSPLVAKSTVVVISPKNGNRPEPVEITITHDKRGAILVLNEQEKANVTANVAASETSYTANITNANFSEWSVLEYKIGDAAQPTTDANCVTVHDDGANTGSVTIKFPANASESNDVTITLKVGFEGIISRTLTLTQAAAAARTPNVTIDVTNSNWNFPTSATTGSNTYSDGTTTITLSASSNGYKYDGTNKYLLLGKNGSTLTFQSFDFDIDRIKIYGRTGASSSVKQNIYVGDNAVSTETTGATGTNTYDIIANYQASGNIYVLKVTSDANTQITKIEIFGGAPKSVTSVEVSGTPTKTSYEAGEVFNPAGLTVTANYDDGSSKVVTTGITWTDGNGNELAGLAAGTTSVTVKAVFKNIPSEAFPVTGLTVTAPAPKTDLDEPSGLTWTESSKTLSWTDLNTRKGTYGTNYKYQYSVNGGSSWSDATTSTTAVLSITSTTKVKVKAVAITTVTHNSSSEVEKSCTITAAVKTTATLTLSNNKKFGTTSGSTLNDDEGNTWTCTGTGIQNSYQSSYSGQQFGTGSTANTYTFTCTPPDGKTVTSVKIKAACGNSNGKYKIEVGSNVWKDFSALSTSSTAYTATGSATGQIKITLQQPQSGTKKAVYLGMIEIIYQ